MARAFAFAGTIGVFCGAVIHGAARQMRETDYHVQFWRFSRPDQHSD
jgi:hypothetical protein